MRRSGRLVEWNDARGFGFVQADGSSERVFVHISAWQPRPGPQQRPQVGMPLTFVRGMEQGKPRAQAVAWQGLDLRSAPQERAQAAGGGAQPAKTRRFTPAAHTGSSHRGSYAPLWVFAALWAAVAVAWGVPRWVAMGYAGLSLWCFAAYWYDKRQAQSGGWRTPESTLHTLALLGGWPGALLAQQWLRHKSSKPEFRRVFWVTVVLNMLAFALLLSPAGHAWWPRIAG